MFLPFGSLVPVEFVEDGIGNMERPMSTFVFSVPEIEETRQFQSGGEPL